MSETSWPDDFLDEMREVGDEPADAVVAEILEAGEIGEVNRLMKTLVRNDGVPAAELPQAVRDYLDTTDDLPEWADPQRILAGERFFEIHGPACLMALSCASLPSCYADRKGVQVLAMTERLETDAVRRVGETTQMNLDVMAPGGLAPGGAGIRTAQKVRLMHGAVRQLVRTSDHWDPEWGTPINQEDLALTLLTFSVVVLDALAKLGTTFDDADADAYFHCWNCVGHILGVDERLLAVSVDEARDLLARIIERNWAPCPEGRAMTKALIDAIEDATPGTVFDGFPSYVVRFLGGDELGDILGVRPTDWTAALGGPLRRFARDSDAAGDMSPAVARVARHFSKQLLEGFAWVARGGERAPFDIPQHLAERWEVGAAKR